MSAGYEYIGNIPEYLVAKWGSLPDDSAIDKTVQSLKKNSIKAYIANDKEEAKNLVASFIPKGAEVWTSTSITLRETGIMQLLDESGEYISIRKKVFAISDPVQRLNARRATATTKYVVGSVHAVTQDGVVLIASMTGSQLPYYAYSSENVIWVVGAQKIVHSINDGFKRIEEYCAPLEDLRAKKESGTGTSINKILIIKKENIADRLKMIIVKERLGF
ncbi:MAG: LUD domain-containing protein [Conexivisphaerales archaeon]